MKIDQATCRRNAVSKDDEYIASVRVTSDGKSWEGTGYADEPNRAIHQALSEAIGKCTKPLHDSLRTEITVQF